MSVARRAVRATVMVLASSYLNMGAGLLYSVIMARLLQPQHFGILTLALFFYSLIDLRGKIGLEAAFMHRRPATPQLLGTCLILQTGASLATLVLAIPVSLLLPKFGYAAAVAVLLAALSGTLVLEGAGSTARAALEKDLAFGKSTVIGSLALLLSYLVGIGLAVAGMTYWALLLQIAANALFGCAGFWWVYRRTQPQVCSSMMWDRNLALWMIRYGAKLAAGSIAMLMLLHFDNFLVGTFAGMATLGYYALACKVAQWPAGVVTHIVSRAAFPTYALLQTEPESLSRAFGMSLWLILAAASPLALAIFVSAPDFVQLLYGEKWLPAAGLLRMLAGYMLLRPWIDDTGAFFTAIGKAGKITTVLVTMASIIVLSAPPLTRWYGAAGTAFAVSCAYLVGVILAYILVSQELPIPMRSYFVPPVVALSGALLLWWVVSPAWARDGFSPLLRLCLSAAVVLAAYSSLLVLLDRRRIVDHSRLIWRLLLQNTSPMRL